MSKPILEIEIPSNLACPDCGEQVWTDNDIEFCKSCSWSRSVASKPIRHNQFSKHKPGVKCGVCGKEG
jgi:hypothetical protein